MTKLEAAWMQRFPGIKPWAAVATLLALILFGYYTVLGVRYWTTSGQASSLTDQVSRLSATSQAQSPYDEETSKAELKSQEMRLEETSDVFSYLVVAELVALFDSTAKDTGVDLVSVVEGDPSLAIHQGIQYQTQPATVTLRGQTSRIYGFLSLLRLRVAPVTIAGIRFAGLEGSPLAEIQLQFYLSPQPTEEILRSNDAVPSTTE